MNKLPQVYQKYNLMFTPRLIPRLRDLRGSEWADLVDTLTKLPETSAETLAFSKMMIDLGGCLSCEMDSYRAQRGCGDCAQHTTVKYKGSDKQLLMRYKQAHQVVSNYLAKIKLKK